MKVLDPGHRYALQNLESDGETILQFMKDPALHDGDGCAGPSCQEVLRAVIDRVQELDRERPWVGNAQIIYDLRHALAGFEARALVRRVEKGGLAIELQPVAADGHLRLASVDERSQSQDAAERLGPEDASAVPSEETGDAQTPPSQPSTGAGQ